MRSEPTQTDARFAKLTTGANEITTSRKMGVTDGNGGWGGGVGTSPPKPIPGSKDS